MKLLQKLCCSFLALCSVLWLAVPLQAYSLIHTEKELQTAYSMHSFAYGTPTSDMAVYDDFIMYKGIDFINSIRNISYDFRSVPHVFTSYYQKNDDTYHIPINRDLHIDVSDISITDSENGEHSPVLAFTYNVSGYVADTSKSTYVIALYRETGTQDDPNGNIVGQQFIEYATAGTEFETNGKRANIIIPINFDPLKFDIGIVLWQTEDTPVKYEYAGGYSYLASPATESSPVSFIDLSDFTSGFNTWTPTQSDYRNLPSYNAFTVLSDEDSDYISTLINESKNRDDCGLLPGIVIGITHNNIGITYPQFDGRFTNGASIQVLDQSPYTMTYIAITDKTTSEALWLLKIDEYRFNAVLTLPDDFDSAKHDLVFFEYNYYGHISRMCITDPANYIFGDVDKNGHVNLLDVTMMLKNIAGWKSVEIDRSMLSGKFKNVYENKNGYTLNNVSSVLKIIAGWSVNQTFGSFEGYEYLLGDPLCSLSGLAYKYVNVQ